MKENELAEYIEEETKRLNIRNEILLEETEVYKNNKPTDSRITEILIELAKINGKLVAYEKVLLKVFGDDIYDY